MQLKGLLTGLFRWHYRQHRNNNVNFSMILMIATFAILCATFGSPI